MARMRSVKPEFWADEDLADLPRDARLLYIGLWNLADEHARLRGRPDYIKGQLFPYDDDLDAAAIDALLNLLTEAGKAIRYSVAGRSYIHLPNLGKHQRLEPDKVPSRLPEPSESSQPQPIEEPSEPDADESARDADESESDAKDHALSMWHVTGSMEHGAGGIEHGRARRKPRADPIRGDPADFDRFWKIYPRRVAKSDAERAWAKAITKADVETILVGAQRLRDQPGRDPAFTPYPATWLNGARWADEPPVRGSPNGHRPYQNPIDPGAYEGDL